LLVLWRDRKFVGANCFDDFGRVALRMFSELIADTRTLAIERSYVAAWRILSAV